MYQRDTFEQFESLALPKLDAGIRLPHPLGVVGMEIDGDIPERTAPVDQRRVEVGMRDRDGAQPAKPVDQGDRGVIDQRDAIPQDIPLSCAKEHGALADRELALRADPDQPRLVLAESVVARNPEPLQRRPRLALGRDVLALIFADGALSRWGVTRRILRAAGTA